MNKEFIRIGTKFPYKNKIFEIIDLVEGSSKTYTGTLVFYKNGEGVLRVRTMESFLEKFKMFQ